MEPACQTALSPVVFWRMAMQWRFGSSQLSPTGMLFWKLYWSPGLTSVVTDSCRIARVRALKVRCES